tara:strand:+ start:156 stop:332 length:177 start_codon:yes stop_codon:yes gene_type:complete
MDNILKQINNNTIKLTKNGESKIYRKVIPGMTDKNYPFYGVTLKDLFNYIKYKGEHYA